MAENVSKLTLTQKLAQIRAMSDAVRKTRDGFGYKYADITDILAKVTSGMKKYNVSLIPSIVQGTASSEKLVSVNTKTDKQGNTYEKTTTEMLVSADMIFRWVNNDDPSDVIEVPWFVIGSQADPSQAYGTGLSYSMRYFLTNFFQIAQPELDVDAYRSKQKAAEEAEAKSVLKEIISKLDKEIRGYLGEHTTDNDKSAVRALTTKYIKSGNYLKITDANLAGKLLEEFKNTFVKGGE